MAGWVEGGVGVRPLLVACAAFLAGAFLGISLPWWVALLPLPLLFWTPSRAVALGLTFGLLRGAVQENPVPFTLEEEFEGRVISPDLVRVPQGLVALRLRGLPVYRGDRARFFGAVPRRGRPQIEIGCRRAVAERSQVERSSQIE